METADARAEARIIADAVMDAPWTGRRGMRQARIAQRGQATLVRARNALAELAQPSGIAGADRLAVQDTRECADLLDADILVLDLLAADDHLDNTSRNMAITTSTNLRDMVLVLRQASLVSMD